MCLSHWQLVEKDLGTVRGYKIFRKGEYDRPYTQGIFSWYAESGPYPLDEWVWCIDHPARSYRIDVGCHAPRGFMAFQHKKDAINTLREYPRDSRKVAEMRKVLLRKVVAVGTENNDYEPIFIAEEMLILDY